MDRFPRVGNGTCYHMLNGKYCFFFTESIVVVVAVVALVAAVVGVAVADGRVAVATAVWVVVVEFLFS